MNISVHLHTILQRQTSEGIVNRLDLNLSTDATLADLLAFLEVELAPEALLLVVNGRTAELTQELEDGDQVHLMPAISGGCGSP